MCWAEALAPRALDLAMVATWQTEATLKKKKGTGGRRPVAGATAEVPATLVQGRPLMMGHAGRGGAQLTACPGYGVHLPPFPRVGSETTFSAML